MQTKKITKFDIKNTSSFETKIGIVYILSIEKNGYRNGVDRVFTKIDNGNEFCDTIEEVTAFINENI